nr:hypothetical protein [Tanacetum cinerariifolium]
VLRESVNVWNLQRWWVSSMIMLEAMTIHFEVASIWVDQLGGSVWVDFRNANLVTGGCSGGVGGVAVMVAAAGGCGVEVMVTRVADENLWVSAVGVDEGGVAAVEAGSALAVVKGGAARGREWCMGSDRSGDGEHFWVRRKRSPEKFSSGGGRRWWRLAVMSDASSVVTYTSVYTDSEPWRYYGEDLAETGPLRVIVYGYDGLLIQPIAPPSSYYVPGPEHPPSPDYVPSLEHPPSPIEIPYVPELEYPEYLAPYDDEAPLEDQPLPADASPIAASPGYMADSNLEEDPEEDPEDDQADYPVDGEDGDDEPSDDDDDDYTVDEDPEEEPFEDEEDDKEEEH